MNTVQRSLYWCLCVSSVITAGLVAVAGPVPPPAVAIADGKNSSALDEVKGTIDEVIKINETYPGEEAKQQRRAALRTAINKRFDFEEMARRSLGTNWSTISAEQQKEFTTLFSELLTRTYLNRVEAAARDTITYNGETIEYPKSYVKTLVTIKADKFPIDYKLLERNGDWRVYDVLIENIGLVGNYRNEFSGIMRKDGIEGLLSMLNEKVKKLS